MKEDFLHYLWKFSLLKHQLKTTNGAPIEVLQVGTHNHFAGPDFTNAKLRINDQLWAGNVEIHIKSSDWYAHHHERDANYDAVILHVVYEHDVEVFNTGNQPIPTLEIKGLIPSIILQNYRRLFTSERHWINCQTQLKNVPTFTISNWQERLFFERLEQKSKSIVDLLKKTNNDYEAVLFCLLAKGFGLKMNQDAFLNLAQSFDFSILRKERFDLENLEALFFGQAGFLQEDSEESYVKNLQQRYAYLQTKYNIEPLHKRYFQFFRLRPNNFPTIRLSQLANVYHLHSNLFSKLMETTSMDAIYDAFAIGVSAFWQTHYTFEKESRKLAKKLTKSFIDLLVVNTVIPLQFVYLQSVGKLDIHDLIAKLQDVKPEKNSIVDRFSSFGITAENAYESQSLLQLKNEYCSKQRCLDCVIGSFLLNEAK